MKEKLNKLLVFFLLCQLHVTAQKEGYNYEAAVNPVDSSGFYNIVLTPELNAHLKTDYSDLRVVNDSGKWVPHLVRQPKYSRTNEILFGYLQILAKEQSPDFTTIILQCRDSNVTNILLTIKNTAAKRYCSLSGSDDKNSWYVINDSIEMKSTEIGKADSSWVWLSFPKVNYRYFKIVINNLSKEPINVLSANTQLYTDLLGKFFTPSPLENPGTKFLQKDSNQITYLKVEQSKSYQFDHIALQISGVKYFKRKAEVYIPAGDNHSFSNPGTLVQAFTLSDNNALEFDVPLSNANSFYILINNNDNPPLKVESIKTFITYKVATVYLEKSKRYSLLLNNSSAKMPDFDLSIKDIPEREQIPYASVGAFISLQKPELIQEQKTGSKNLIWLIISIAAVVLGFFTYRLITDMNKSKN